MGMDFAFEFTFALTIHTGKDVQAVSRKSRIGIAAKSAFSIISTVARINNGGDVEMTCIWLTFAVRRLTGISSEHLKRQTYHRICLGASSSFP